MTFFRRTLNPLILLTLASLAQGEDAIPVLQVEKFRATRSGETDSMAFHPTKPILAVGGPLGDISIWDVSSKPKRVQTLRQPAPDSVRLRPSVYAIEFSPDGTRLATGTAGHLGNIPSLVIWETKQWKTIARAEFSRSESGPIGLAFSSDSRRVAACGIFGWHGSSKHGIRVFHVEHLRHDCDLTVTGYGPSEVHFVQNNKRILSIEPYTRSKRFIRGAEELSCRVVMWDLGTQTCSTSKHSFFTQMRPLTPLFPRIITPRSSALATKDTTVVRVLHHGAGHWDFGDTPKPMTHDVITPPPALRYYQMGLAIDGPVSAVLMGDILTVRTGARPLNRFRMSSVPETVRSMELSAQHGIVAVCSDDHPHIHIVRIPVQQD